jgi:cytochrome P450
MKMGTTEAAEPADPDPELDPHADWAQARREAPVRHGAVFGRPGYTVHRWDDVEAVLRDSETFSCSIVGEMMGPFMGVVLNSKDGAEHTRYRNLVSRAFRQSAVDRWEGELVRPIIDELIDAIAPLGRADLVRDVTRRYPMRVIAGIIGVPLRDQDQFMRWAEAINLGPLQPEAGRAASRAMREYLAPIVEDRRRRPRGDLISDIVHAEIDGEKLDDEHIYGFLRLLLPAGAETTFRVMGNCLCALLTRPADLERVRSDPSRLLPKAIEETLRWETSVTMVSRIAVRPTRIGDTPIGAGESVSLITASANRDESRHAHPDEWDLDRADKRHLAFGWGRHVCLGMHLARLELAVGIGALLERLPGLRLDPAAPRPEIRGLAFRGPDTLPVLFDAAP